MYQSFWIQSKYATMACSIITGFPEWMYNINSKYIQKYMKKYRKGKRQYYLLNDQYYFTILSLARVAQKTSTLCTYSRLIASSPQNLRSKLLCTKASYCDLLEWKNHLFCHLQFYIVNVNVNVVSLVIMNNIKDQSYSLSL